ncbi:MAG TPA: LolA-related protein [Lysobacter sp.]
MTRLKTTCAALLACLLAAAPLAAAPPDAGASRVEADWILARLARPAPMRTGFVELRGSALLKAPLRIEGEYQRPRDGTLVREVRVPYAETTTIRAGEVQIARAGKSPRTFSLSRAPELGGLQASFGALLSGDRALLEQHYRIAVDGTRARWVMTLTPKQPGLAAQLRSVVLRGRGAELRCIDTQPIKGDLQRTLLAGAARAAAGVSDASALQALCHGNGNGVAAR